MKLSRIVWLFAALLAAAGYALLIAPDERAIAGVQLRAKAAYDEAAADDATVRRSAVLGRVRREVDADLRRLSGRQTAEGVTATALRLFDLEAQRFHVAVRSVAPDGGQTPAPESPLRGSDWTVGLRGRFRDVMLLIADLPARDALLEIRDVDLAAPRQDLPAPVLDVTLHATLYRLAAPVQQEVDQDARS